MTKSMRTAKDTVEYQPQPRVLFSASEEEIRAGLTTDVYFVNTHEVLHEVQQHTTVVTAEIFPRSSGILAGTEEVVNLLRSEELEVWALPEGTPFTEKQCVMRIKGAYGAFGIYETALLGILASSSGWATAARRAKEAAKGKPVYAFGARHVHPAVAPVMERAAIKGGVDGSACILGAKLAGQQPVGTVPHALFLIIGDTVEAAKIYDSIMPESTPRTILIDTFKDEAEEALRVCEALGSRLKGVRVDTPGERGGVTPGLIQELRAKLDLAGYRHVQIFASGGLYPEKLSALADAGADAFGVGSFISGASPIDMTMDIKEVAGQPVAKRGRLPGISSSTGLTKVL